MIVDKLIDHNSSLRNIDFMPSIGVSDINNFIDLYDEKTCGKHS
jgi:hypothetical protein